MQAKPQPYYDFEIAKICAWLKERGLSMHVKSNGSVEFRRVQPKENP